MDTKHEKDTGSQVEESRRRFLKTAGKIAVYAPPAMLVMSQPSYAHFKTTGGQDCTTEYTQTRIRTGSWLNFFH